MKTLPISLAGIALALAAGTAFAADVILIDQNKVLAGNVTPGDSPGFPATLYQSGTYKLMSNLIVPSGKDGIHIANYNVTLDLNGFTIIGPVTCTGSGAARTCPGAGPNAGSGVQQQYNWFTKIRNGTVRGFAGYGIVGVAQGSTLEDMTVRDNGMVGVHVWEPDVRMLRSIVTGNGGDGLMFVQPPALLEDVVVTNNAGVGVHVYSSEAADYPAMGGQLRRMLIARNGSYGLEVGIGTSQTTVHSSNMLGPIPGYGGEHVRGNACAGAAC